MMKKLVTLLFSLLLVVSAVSAATADSVQKSVTVDGDASDWDGVNSYSIDEQNTAFSSTSSPSDFSGSFRSAWDNQYLYFLVEMTDDEFDVTGGDYIFVKDAVELMLDGGNEKTTSYDENDYHIHVTGDGQQIEVWVNSQLVDSNPSSIVADGAQTSDGYVLEIGVSWSYLGGQSPGNGVTYGFDIAVNDRDNEAYEDQLMWQYADSHDKDTSGWGSLTLSGTSTSSTISLSPSNLDFTSSNTNDMDVTVSDTIVYDTGYYSTDGGNDWNEFTLSGSTKVDKWALSSASSTLALGLSEVNATGNEMIAFYACTWNNGWDCHGDNWQIEEFQVTLPEPDVGPVCGNGILETGEECDGTDFGGETCQTYGFDEGTLSCSSCTIDLSSCYDMVNASSDSVEGDFQALQDLYSATAGPSWDDNTGWESATPQTMGDMYGIEVYEPGHEFEGRVKRVDLGFNNLVGQLPDSIGDLTKARFFKVKHNYLDGSIPASMGNMRELRWLLLSGASGDPNLDGGQHPGKSITETNHFTGQLPAELGNLVNLQIFELARATMEGPLPSSIGNWKDLRVFAVVGRYNGDGFSGQLPSSIGNWVKLRDFQIGRNTFEGPLPESIGNWSVVRNMWIFGNRLTSIPDSIENLGELTHFFASANSFRGEFPYQLFTGGNPKLGTFLVYDVRKLDGSRTGVGLYGNISKINFSNTPNLNHFGFGMNFQLEGELPSSISDLNPIIAGLDNNGATGPVPDTSSWDRVRNMYIYNDRYDPEHAYTGPLPTVDPSGTSLRRVHLYNNNFTGKIPEAYALIHRDENGQITEKGFSAYKTFDVHNNNLSGRIPVGLADYAFEDFSVELNKFVFSDIIPVLEAGPSGFTYAPQKPIGVSRSITLSSGGNVVIDDFEDRFNHSGNVYQWQKDGSDLAGENSKSLSLSNVQSSDAGDYTLEITNPSAPALVLSTQPVELIVN